MAEDKTSTRSLKSANFVWLCTLVTFDVVVLAALIFPGAIELMSGNRIEIARGFSSALLPIVPLLLTNTVPQLMKARLVFWRWHHPNPGSRAFSECVHGDDRVNVDKLRENIGEFPVSPKDQNSLWYSLYRKIQDDVGVRDAHKAFLLYRDMTSLSLMLLILTALVMTLWGFKLSQIGKVASVFLIQYGFTMVSARVAGNRLVCTVLSIYSMQKVPVPN